MEIEKEIEKPTTKNDSLKLGLELSKEAREQVIKLQKSNPSLQVQTVTTRESVEAKKQKLRELQARRSGLAQSNPRGSPSQLIKPPSTSIPIPEQKIIETFPALEQNFKITVSPQPSTTIPQKRRNSNSS